MNTKYITHLLSALRTSLAKFYRQEEGMSTIEYAMGSLAAAALAAALYLVVSSGSVSDAIENIITSALNNAPG